MQMGIKMKTLVIKYWWTLIAFMAFVMIILLILVMSAPATVFETILGILLLMTLIALPVSWIVLLINKQWRKCLLSYILSIVTIFVLGGMLSFAAMWGPGYDNFGKKHPIPDGLKYNIPMDRDSIAITPVDSLDADAFLQVQGHYGEYSYDLFYGPLPAGEVFLRCYEATKNIPLSEDRLTERSKVAIDSTITFSQLVHNKSFTIYEGDWEDYYAARIEVWFKNKETKEECKLLEKVYRVDGWMR